MKESNKNWNLEDVFELLGDECGRSILANLDQEPMSAKELSEECGLSLPTIYRRTRALTEHDMINKKMRISSDGSHYSVYESNVEEIHIQLSDGEALHLDSFAEIDGSAGSETEGKRLLDG